VFDLVVSVDAMQTPSPVNLRLLGRPELATTLTKLHVWRLTQFTKIVFLDADTLAVRNVDELFQHDELSACPDAGWPGSLFDGARQSDARLLQFRRVCGVSE
jgi:glycogenin glucosyltransferase